MEFRNSKYINIGYFETKDTPIFILQGCYSGCGPIYFLDILKSKNRIPITEKSNFLNIDMSGGSPALPMLAFVEDAQITVITDQKIFRYDYFTNKAREVKALPREYYYGNWVSGMGQAVFVHKVIRKSELTYEVMICYQKEGNELEQVPADCKKELIYLGN